MPNNTVTGVLFKVRRLASSSSGNPRFSITLDTGNLETYTISSNSRCSYCVENHKIGSVVTLKLTKAGRFYDIKKAV